MTPAELRHASTDAYAQWLSSASWDLFVTITDPRMSHPEAMLKQSTWYMNKINRHLYGKHWAKKGLGVEYVVGLERQKRGSVHAHILVRFPDHEVTPQLLEWLRSTALGTKIDNPTPAQRSFPYKGGLSGWSKVEIPRDQDHVTYYVCKYVTKEGELHFSDNFDPYRPRVFDESLMGAMSGSKNTVH